MSEIKILIESVSNQIVDREVIERPSAVVKELGEIAWMLVQLELWSNFRLKVKI
jgi:hypothetical protein